MPDTIQNFISSIKTALNNNEFVKLTLGKAANKNLDLRNIYVRLVEIKEVKMLSFTYRNKTNDIVKNYSFEDALAEIEKYLGNDLLSGHLFTTKNDIELLFNKKRKAKIRTTEPTFESQTNVDHDKKKKRILKVENNIYLRQLGITNNQGKVIPDKNDKFKQINKYVEVFESLIKQVKLPEKIRIV
ncbi:MAG: hypothetical protein K8R41_08275, partial [Bacteroidales bacterium]|nr:hypothetical protein [Bacteroidales bacterium]